MGLSRGGLYAFDEKAYQRFFPLANRHGFELETEDFSTPSETGMHFVDIGG